eukprot:6201392-Pleurochrysis_carterae.AAC.4
MTHAPHCVQEILPTRAPVKRTPLNARFVFIAPPSMQASQRCGAGASRLFDDFLICELLNEPSCARPVLSIGCRFGFFALPPLPRDCVSAYAMRRPQAHPFLHACVCVCQRIKMSVPRLLLTNLNFVCYFT